MPAYIVLGNFTDQGARGVKQLAQLRQQAEQWVAAKQGRIVANYITFGPYDFVFIVELPSPDIALEAAFLFGSQGGTRSQTMLGFAPDEAEAVAARLP